MRALDSRPRDANTSPAAPLISAGCTNRAERENASAPFAQFCAPRISEGAPGTLAPSPMRTTTFGSSTARRPSKSPARTAARKASITTRWLLRSGSGTVSPPRTRRRARLASCLAAAGVRPTIGAISSKGRSNTSCSTNATRSAGASVSSTTRSAAPTESARRASCSGSFPLLLFALGSTGRASNASSRSELRDRNMSRHTRATIVVSQPRMFRMPVAPLWSIRSQAFWTASSASASEPSIR